eukprot:scaffold57144_cov66-Phaeocystis_antarctica.AAC.5
MLFVESCKLSGDTERPTRSGYAYTAIGFYTNRRKSAAFLAHGTAAGGQVRAARHLLCGTGASSRSNRVSLVALARRGWRCERQRAGSLARCQVRPRPVELALQSERRLWPARRVAKSSASCRSGSHGSRKTAHRAGQ